MFITVWFFNFNVGIISA